MFRWIKRKLKICDSCWKKAGFIFEYPQFEENQKEEFDYCCYDHAITSGFCIGCHYFMAGIESFDFSEVKGMCSDCIDDMNYDLGMGEYYGEADYYDDYAHSFDEKQTS